MVSAQRYELIGIKQAITNYAVAASKLSDPLCLIIEVSARRARKKDKKAESRIQNSSVLKRFVISTEAELSGEIWL